MSDRTLRILGFAAIALSALYVFLFLVTAHRRMHFAFDLEWVEDGNLQELWRVVAHQPLYVAPSIDYVPYLYAPLYFWLAAVVARFTGVGFQALRLLSIVGTLGTMAGLFAIVWLEFRGAARAVRWLAASLAVGFFACAYPVSNSFFDFGRVDMVCLCFTIFALLAGRRGFPVLAALLWVAAFQTKQGILPVALLALCFEWQQPRRIVLGLGTFSVLAGGSVLWLNHVSGGWYGRYAFGLAGGFPLLARQIGHFFPQAIFGPFGILCLLALAALLTNPPAWRGRTTAFYLVSGLGLVMFTWYITAHGGASANSLLPAYLYLALVGSLAVGRMLLRLRASDATWARAAQALILCAVLVQLAMHSFTPGMFQPTRDYREELTSLIADLRKLPGDVLVMDHSTYAVMAGHSQHSNGEAAIAVLIAGKGAPTEDLRRSYRQRIYTRSFTAIALDAVPAEGTASMYWLPADFALYYPVTVQVARLGTYSITPYPGLLYMPCPTPGQPDPATLFPNHLVDESRCVAPQRSRQP